MSILKNIKVFFGRCAANDANRIDDIEKITWYAADIACISVAIFVSSIFMLTTIEAAKSALSLIMYVVVSVC